MIKLPSGVDIGHLVHDLRDFSWEASDILLYYSQILKESKDKSNFLKNVDNNEPVTIADLKVNDIIIQKINEKYKDINWEILSEENVKISSENNVEYRVFDVNGITISRGYGNTIDLSSFANGVYFLKFKKQNSRVISIIKK